MQFGLNLMLFGDTVTDEVMKRLDLVRQAGYDGVEVPVFAPEALDAEGVRRAAESRGLALTASGALPPGSSLCGGRAGARALAEQYVRGALHACARMGATVFCGPLYKPVGETGGALTPAQQREQAGAALRPLAAQAAQLGVKLAVEPLNRFETDVLNTVADAVELARSVGSPGLGLLLDTFHMHIEEKDSASAIGDAAEAGLLAHFHASENDRGVPGTGQVDWEGVASALWACQYEGWVVLETFNQQNEAIRRAVSCWRPFYPDEAQYLRDGLCFAKSTFRPNHNTG